MTGAVVGVVVSAVAVAAWLGGRWAARAAVLPRKSDQKVIEGAEGSITFPETDRKVIEGPVGGRKLQEKVIGPRRPDPSPQCGAAAQRPTPADHERTAEHELARSRDEAEQKIEGDREAQRRDEASPTSATAEGTGESKTKPPPRILVGARPDAGTTLRLDAPPTGWPEHVRRDREAGQLVDAAGKLVEVERRGDGGEVLVLRARGQARLLIWPERAELVVGSRALDTLGGIVGWAREWLVWASAYLLGASLDPTRPLEAADELGWTPTAVDLAAGLAGWGPLLDEHQDPDRWTQQTVPLPVPASQGRLASIQLGEKCSHPLSVYGYDKTRRAERTGRGAGWLERMRQAGREPGEAVWRWELRLRGQALQLRKRGRGPIVVDFRRCATLADQAAIARAWAYAFGNPRSDRPSGHYRLTTLAERFDEHGRGLPLTRTRPVDPLWKLVQAAGGQAPIESLAQVRERKDAARAEWRRKADEVALRGLAAIVALDHRDDAQTAAHAALHRARELVFGEGWTAAHERQVAATHDLAEPEPEPEPSSGPGAKPESDHGPSPVPGAEPGPNSGPGTELSPALETEFVPDLHPQPKPAPEQPRSDPMNAKLSLVDTKSSPELQSAAAAIAPDAPTWSRRPTDAVARWKARELAPHRFAGVVRKMNAEERTPTRASLELCGYDGDWPIVLYEGQILDGRARDELAFELWQETGREDLIPRFVELVPDDPDRGDEVALLYLQQRLIATRTLSEGERVAAAFRLFQLYRESRAKRPALAPAGDEAEDTNVTATPSARPRLERRRPSPASARGRSSATRSSKSTGPRRSRPTRPGPCSMRSNAAS